MTRRRSFFSALAVVVFSGCSGGGGALPAHSNVTQAMKGTLPLTIVVPTQSAMRAKRPLFVSPNTQSLAVYLYAAGTTVPSAPTATANISATSAGCALNGAGTAITCTVDVEAPYGTAEAQIDAMSGTNGTGSVLATVTQSVTIAAGMQPLTITLDGTPAIIRLMLQTPVLALGTAGTSVLDVDAYDASGALIVAPGSFSAPLTVSVDSSYVTLASTTATAPGTQINVTYGGSTSAPYAVHFAGSGGGIASNLIIGATLDLDPPQSIAMLTTNESQGFGVSTLATTSFGSEALQSYVPLSNNLTGISYEGFAVLPSGAYAVNMYNYSTEQCTLAVWPATAGALPYTPSTFSPPSTSEACPVAAEANGDVVASDNGGESGTELTEYSVSTSGLAATGRTINLSGAPGSPGAVSLAENTAGTIAVTGFDGSYEVLVYAPGASGTPAPANIELPLSAQSIAIDSSGSVYVLAYGSSGGYQVNEYNASLSPTITIAATPPPSDSEYPEGIGVDSAGEVLVSNFICPETSGSCTSGVDVYASGSTTIERTIPLAYAVSNSLAFLGPVVVPSPAPPSSGQSVSGDMLGYVASRTWTYSGNANGVTVYFGLYADPQLVNGNIRLIGFESTTSSGLFSTTNEVGSLDVTRLSGSYLAAAFASVSSGVAGISGSIPGTPLLVPSSLAVNQTWNPEQNATFVNVTGGSAYAQVVAVGSVPGISGCPSGSSSSGATVQYSVSEPGSSGGSFDMSYVPGCGITSFSPIGAGIATLQSVGSMSSLGQLTVPAGQPPFVAALHKLWQGFFNVHPPSNP